MAERAVPPRPRPGGKAPVRRRDAGTAVRNKAGKPQRPVPDRFDFRSEWAAVWSRFVEDMREARNIAFPGRQR